MSAEPAPAPRMDDPGNLFDTDETFAEVNEHNAVYDRLCAGSTAGAGSLAGTSQSVQPK